MLIHSSNGLNSGSSLNSVLCMERNMVSKNVALQHGSFNFVCMSYKVHFTEYTNRKQRGQKTLSEIYLRLEYFRFGLTSRTSKIP